MEKKIQITTQYSKQSSDNPLTKLLFSFNSSGLIPSATLASHVALLAPNTTIQSAKPDWEGQKVNREPDYKTRGIK